MTVINGRRILRSDAPALIKLLVEQRAAYRNEVLRLQAELVQAIGQLRELQAVVLARHGVVAELTGLYRERQIMLARAAERDQTRPLQ